MTREDITFQDKFGELMLDIGHPNSQGITFILVEGNDDSDVRLYRKLFNDKTCKIEPIPGGYLKVEEAVESLLNGYDLIIGIRDADFIHLQGEEYSKVNMFLTDKHDIEMTMLAEDDVFSAVTHEFIDIEQTQHTTFRDSLLNNIKPLSLLKYLNCLNDLELKFAAMKGFTIDLISFQYDTFDLATYFGRLLAKSPKAKERDFNIIRDDIIALDSNPLDLFQLSNGHDAIKAFALFIKTSGNKHGKSISDDTFPSFFRTAFRKEHFYKTTLYSNIKNWADSKGRSIF